MALENNPDMLSSSEKKKKKSLHNAGRKLLYRPGLNQFACPFYSRWYGFLIKNTLRRYTSSLFLGNPDHEALGHEVSPDPFSLFSPLLIPSGIQGGSNCP